MIPRRE